MPLFGVHTCHSLLGLKLVAWNEDQGCCHWSRMVQLGASCYRANAWLFGPFSERAGHHHLSMTYSRLFSLAGLYTTGWESAFSFPIWLCHWMLYIHSLAFLVWVSTGQGYSKHSTYSQSPRRKLRQFRNYTEHIRMSSGNGIFTCERYTRGSETTNCVFT